MTARGVRNNNPGNIRKGDQWQGLDTPGDDGEFCCFESPAYGIRALARVLITYQDKRIATDGSAIDTVQEIIERWAPPSENDTQSYVRSVRKAAGVQPGEHIDCHDFGTLSRIVKAIIKHENGVQPYTNAQITKGLVLAGVEPPKPKRSRTVTGAQVAGGATVLGMAGEYAGQVSALVPAASQVFDFIASIPLWVVGVVALAAVAWVVWARLDDNRKGLR